MTTLGGDPLARAACAPAGPRRPGLRLPPRRARWHPLHSAPWLAVGRPAPELGRGSGVTCWRPLRERHDLGIWGAMHQVALNGLGDLALWIGAGPASTASRARRGGEHTGPNPTNCEGWQRVPRAGRSAGGAYAPPDGRARPPPCLHAHQACASAEALCRLAALLVRCVQPLIQSGFGTIPTDRVIE